MLGGACRKGLRMRYKVVSRATVLAIVGVVISACTAHTQSVRDHAASHLPTAGESYFVLPARPGMDTAEFTRYAAAADEALRARGLVGAANPQSAALLVKVDFGVGRVEQRVWARDQLSFFRRHMPNDYSSGVANQRLPTTPAMQTFVRSRQRDFVEIGVVRGSDNRILFEGIATRPTTRSHKRALEALVHAAFARWIPASSNKI